MNLTTKRCVWMAAAIVLIVSSVILLTVAFASDPKDESRSVPQIQNATSLAAITVFLLSSNAVVREAALCRWQALPINLADQDAARALVKSPDRAVKRYALQLSSDLDFLSRQPEYRLIVLGEMETADAVGRLHKYLTGKDEMLRHFALIKWARIASLGGDKPMIEALMTNADCRVAKMAVAKYGQMICGDDETRKLGALGVGASVPPEVKVEIVKALGQIRSERSEDCIAAILENSLRQKNRGDIEYAYRDPEYYGVAQAAIEALGQSGSDRAKRWLSKVAGDASIYHGLRQQTLKAMQGKESEPPPAHESMP